MAAKVYVGNLSWNTTDETLRNAFSSFGQITDSIVMRDRETGRSRGFGFVTYVSQQEADTAIDAMNDQEFEGRRIKVNLANARTGGGGGYNSGAGNVYQGGGGYNQSPGAGYGGQPQGGGGGYGGYPQQGAGGYGYQGGASGGYQGGASGGYGGYPQQGGYPPSGGYGSGGGY